MRRLIAICLTAVLFCTGSAMASTPGFQGLGYFPNGSSKSVPYGVSADGSVVVGYSGSEVGDTAFIWQNGQMTALSNDIHGSNAYAASANGSVIVGERWAEAIRWENGQETVLGDLPGGETNSHACGVSADGSVVVGYSFSSLGAEAFRWSNGTMTGLGYLNGGLDSAAYGISADGSVIVGDSRLTVGREAFRWENGQMTGLGDLPGGDFFSSAAAVSADGSTIVGYSKSASGYEAFRWTEAGGMEGLGLLSGSASGSAAYDVSGDGSSVVGATVFSDPEFVTGAVEAFIWDKDNGMQNLKDLLENKYGLNLTGWTLYAATGISDDGRTITGLGLNPDGNPEGWIVTIPEPVNPCTTPPDFELSASPAVLWPPNHKMVKITPTWDVNDICDSSPQVSLVAVTEDGQTNSDDIQITDDGSIYLRAEKSRTYTLTYKAVNSSGLSTTKSVVVSVPHDNGKGK